MSMPNRTDSQVNDVQSDVTVASTIKLLSDPGVGSLFWNADRLDRGSAWFGHIPLAHWIMWACRPRIFVELGTHAGVSYTAFCQAVDRLGLDTRCFAIDTWEGDHQAGRYDNETFNDWVRFHDQRFCAYSTLIRSRFDDALDKFTDGSIDLLHIDGLHTYEAVKHDFESWKPKLSERAIVLFHDTNERQSDFGVWRLWRELCEQYQGFEFLHSHGLGVLCVGASAAEQVKQLCAICSRDEAHAVRTAFETIGKRWELDATERQLRGALIAQEAHAAHAKAVEVGEAKAESAALRREIDNLRVDNARYEEEKNHLQRLSQETEQLNAALNAAVDARHKAEHSYEIAEQARRSEEAKFVRAMNEVSRLAASAHAAEIRAVEASSQRDAVLTSSAWRVTAPLRSLAGRLPMTVRKTARKAMKATYWAITPWKTPQRIRFLRERRRAAAVVQPMASVQTYRTDAPNVAAIRLDAASPRYGQWIVENEADCWKRLQEGAGVNVGVPVSFLIPVTGISIASDVAQTVDSIRRQAGNWEILIGFASAPDARFQAVLQQLANSDERIRCLQTNGKDKATVLAELVSEACLEYVAILDGGDVLSAFALSEVSACLGEEPDLDVLYGDEDVLSLSGKRDEPYFKPSWSPELLCTFNYLGRLTVLRRSLIASIGGIAVDMGVAVEWDLNLRITAHTEAIRRIPKVLCHRSATSDRGRPRSDTADARAYQHAIRKFWLRQGIDAKVDTQGDGTQRSVWDIAEPPLVSIIIPTKNRHDLLRMCVEGILRNTDYVNWELVIVDTGSTEPETLSLYKELSGHSNIQIVNFNKKFNYSAACNYGTTYAEGELFLFLNNDIEIISRDWLAELVRFAMRPGVGVVGTKLIYPTRVLQHAGVVVGMHLCGLVFRNADEHEWGVFGSPSHPRNYLAIMGACQLIRREAFARVGGFDEAYEIANSDVALCLRAWRAGYRVAYTPFAALVHHEGATRGYTNPTEDLRRSAFDLRRLGFEDDPYFHPGLSGTEGIPALRVGQDPNTKESLRQVTSDLLPFSPVRQELDLFDDYAVSSSVGLPRDKILWGPQSSNSITDQWAAARYCIDLLRSRLDLRQRFPYALSSGASGAFAKWISGVGGDQLSIPASARRLILAAISDDLGRRVRQCYLCREDLRSAYPLGLTPAGRNELFRWMMRSGRAEADLSREEIWWFFLASAENPAAELVRTYQFTPAWQSLYPNALTVFGRCAFAAWLAERFQIFAHWLDPYAWPIALTPAQQIRLTYYTREDWQATHPDALSTMDGATDFLDWLYSPKARLDDEVHEWLSTLSRVEVAKELAAHGVNIIGHFCYPSGLRTSIEAIEQGLRKCGTATSCRDLRTDKSDDPNHADYHGMELFDSTLIHAQPEPFFDVAYTRSDLFERKPRTYRIGYWYWELELIPDFWREKAKLVDELWAATNFVAEALKSKIDLPVHTMFPGIQLGRFEKRPLAQFGLRTHQKFTFLFTFHMMSIMERKNPLGLIRAFKLAFSKDEPVALVLKTSFGDRHEAQMRALREAAEGADITIIDRVFTQDETLSLMDACDAYISLHRSEGLGLTMGEAMLLGKPVIATRYSGNLDFMDENNSLLVDYKMIRLGKPMPPYEADASWADPSVEHAASLMRRLYENQNWASSLGERAKADLTVRAGLEAAGKRMQSRLAKISIERRLGRHTNT